MKIPTHFFHRALLSLTAPLLLLTQTSAQNLVVNGDFSAGNTGFTSAYSITTDLTPEFTYAIGTDPANFHNVTYTYGDHTTGTGNMMIVNPGSTSGQSSWQQTVSVTPNTIYNLGAWAVGWYLFESTGADIQLSINGTSVGSDLVLTIPTTSGWSHFGGLWNSGVATSATIKVIDLNTSLDGNDFSLDDISLVAVPEPGTMALMIGGSLLVLARAGVRKVISRS